MILPRSSQAKEQCPYVKTEIMLHRGGVRGVNPSHHIETGMMTQRGRSISSPHQDRNKDVVRRGRHLNNDLQAP